MPFSALISSRIIFHISAYAFPRSSWNSTDQMSISSHVILVKGTEERDVHTAFVIKSYGLENFYSSLVHREGNIIRVCPVWNLMGSRILILHQTGLKLTEGAVFSLF